tara:strand:+ start:32328 stop:32852 length:525 start_codon:yes stop_codon:yes gene_type:complete
MAKKRLLVDMDGVLADVYAQFIAYEFEASGTRFKREDVVGIDEVQAFPNGKKHVYQKGFFRTIPVMNDAVDVMKQLSAKYEIFIVSAAMEFPNSLFEKYEWLDEHFPFIHWKHRVFCGDKSVIQGDILIDDHFKNLDYFSGKTYLFTQPHNSNADPKAHERVANWKNIAEKLLG